MGNIEFVLIFSSVCLGLYYIHKNIKSFSDTTRLIGAGIATHLVVDSITYLGDKINTKVKTESFYVKKDLSTNKHINYFFDKKFSHFNQNKKLKRIRNTGLKTLGPYLREFHLKGIQAAMVFATINSFVFYGLYKNLKYFFKDKLGLDGFSNFFLSAATAQFFAMVVAFPLENMKTRMQASNFNYESFYKYYSNIIRGKPWPVISANLKNEYSGFISHLILYVVYESLTFSIYETLMKIKMFKSTNNDSHDMNIRQVLIASAMSGLVSAIITNPIDVYQINKQINPKYSIKQLNKENIMLGLKERIYFITFLNICTFVFLETLGPKYFDVHLE
jgi:hypothetical protein